MSKENRKKNTSLSNRIGDCILRLNLYQFRELSKNTQFHELALKSYDRRYC